jgi:hypothetical protein
MVEGSYLSWARANLVSKTLLGWCRRLPVATRRSPRSAASTEHGRPAAERSTLELTLWQDPSKRLAETEQIDSWAMFAEELDDGKGEEYAVHIWRAEQLRLLGLSPTLAEVFAGLVDWHQIAKLVERGCSPQLALEIVR